MARLVVVHNPRSSRNAKIKKEVLDVANKLHDFDVQFFEVQNNQIMINAIELANELQNKDTVVAVGGDGTAAIVLNAVAMSGKDVTMAALPYGNFNDVAGACGTKKINDIITGKTEEVWPLEVLIDEKLWRYALSYVTIGMFAESCMVFENKKVRKILKNKGGNKVFSIVSLAKWYFERYGERFLPECVVNENREENITDILIINGPKIAGIMRGKKWYMDIKKFDVSAQRNGKIWRLLGFMIRSIMWRVPHIEAGKCEVDFGKSAKIWIQAEGECEEVKAQNIMIRKVEKPIKMIMK